jgi:hypothetical protein
MRRGGSYLRAIAQPLAVTGPLLRPARRWALRSGDERPAADNAETVAAVPATPLAPTAHGFVSRPVSIQPAPSAQSTPIEAPAAQTFEAPPVVAVQAPMDVTAPATPRALPAVTPTEPANATVPASAAQPRFDRATTEPLEPLVVSAAPSTAIRAPEIAAARPLPDAPDDVDAIAPVAPRSASPPANIEPEPLRATPAPPPAKALPVSPAQPRAARGEVLVAAPPRAMAQAAPVLAQETRAAGHTLKIGTIEVKVTPPPAPVPQPVRAAPPAAAAPPRAAPLARGLGNSFGLRQG